MFSYQGVRKDYQADIADKLLKENRLWDMF